MFGTCQTSQEAENINDDDDIDDNDDNDEDDNADDALNSVMIAYLNARTRTGPSEEQHGKNCNTRTAKLELCVNFLQADRRTGRRSYVTLANIHVINNRSGFNSSL